MAIWIWVFNLATGRFILRKAPARLYGWTRCFSQLSVDHRGTPASPGRVLTLRPHKDGYCQGAAFEIADALWQDTLEYLNEREKGGYDAVEVEIEIEGACFSPSRILRNPTIPMMSVLSRWRRSSKPSLRLRDRVGLIVSTYLN